ENCFVVQPSDQAELPQVPKAIYVGQGGNISLIPLRGTAPVTFYNVAGGSILDVRARAVMATGTTALDMVGLV
ncbi:hypothetical protein ACFQGS_23650, partial [Novosphingobium lubricantis]